MEDSFEPDIYWGLCSVCGSAQAFERQGRAIRETYRCGQCRSSLREREQARAILLAFSGGLASSLDALVKLPAFQSIALYEPGTIGPFRRLFKSLSRYQQSDFYSESERASAPADIPHQDLQALTFEDAQFDLVITSDILEHVRKPLVALREIARVLKPGGRHILTVPMQDPVAQQTVVRVDTSGDTDRHLLPPHYHGNGKGGQSLVYHDFGLDISDLMAQAGFHTDLMRPVSSSATVNRIYTLVCTKQG